MVVVDAVCSNQLHRLSEHVLLTSSEGYGGGQGGGASWGPPQGGYAPRGGYGGQQGGQGGYGGQDQGGQQY
jgi:hypothetical protein